ncbi:MAG: helicase-exonuclease AddAB subunit AddA [Spirochaetales bacterium]
MARLTKEQQMVVDERDKNLLVSASAGSGKTHTMIERILNLIVKGEATIKEMLIVTFTRAAASEMKTRLYNALAKEVKNNDSLEKEIDELATADISTIHNFCAKIVKQHFYEVGVDPAFQILDDSDSLVLMNDALSTVLEKYIKKDDKNFNTLFETFNKRRRDVEFKRAIIELYRFLKSKYDYRYFAEGIVEKTYNDDLKNNLSAIYLNKILLEDFKHFKTQFESLKLEVEQFGSAKLALVADSVLNAINLVKDKNTFEKNIEVLSHLPELKDLRGTYSDDEKELKEKVKDKKALFTELIKDKYSKFFDIDALKQNLRLSKNYIQKMLEVVMAFDDYYMALKKDKALLDFNDLEYYALEILKNNDIASSIKNRYKYIFIDEYQDINDVQEELISRVAKFNNAFMVGDVKQSIYMFRQADPQIFVNKYEKFKVQNFSKKIDLNNNFRSEKAVLEFANFVFSNIMLADTASVNYKDDAKFDTNTGAEYEPSINGLPLVSVEVIDAEKEKPEKEILPIYSVQNDTELEEEEISLAKSEAKLISEKILEFLNTKIYDTSQNVKDYRQVEFKDIAILSRYKGDYLKELCNELENYNIPLLAKYSLNIYDSYEARLVNSYLSLINNFKDDVALTNVLSSVIGNLSYDELAEIRIQFPKKAFFYECVENYLTSYKENEITLKIEKLIFELNELKLKSNYLKVPELINAILNKYSLETYFLALPDGQNRLENLKRLVDASYKPELVNNLYKYVSYIQTFGDDEEFEISTGNGANSVTVSTIHSSKGLEYPIVILVGTGRDFTKTAHKGEILINKDLGFGVRYYDLENRSRADTLVREAIELKNKEQNLAEEMRLLYVAVTRAKNHLVLVGRTKVSKLKEVRSVYSIKNTKSYLEWILGSLNESSFNSLLEGQTHLKVKLNGGLDFALNVYKTDDLMLEKQEGEEVILNAPSKEYKEKFKKVFDYVYPHLDSTKIRVKSSVTEIMQEEDEIANNYSIKRFKLDEINKLNDELDFSKIGSAYHKVMQYINFDLKTLEDVAKNIDELVSLGTLTFEEKSLVEVDKILGAIKAVNSLLVDGDKLKKEQQFIMYVPYKEIFESSKITDKILVQGVVDLIIIRGDEAIILDYKTSRLNEDKLLQKYATQLKLYATAVTGALELKVTKKLIYSFHLKTMVIV